MNSSAPPISGPPPSPPPGPLPERAGFWGRVARPIGAVLLAFGLSIPLAAVLLGTDLSDDSVNAIFALVGSALILLFGYVFLTALPAHERRWVTALKHTRGGAVGLGVVIGIGIIIASASLIVLGTLVDGGLEDRLEEQATDVGPELWQIVLMVIALVVLAPLGEELVFRGLLLRGLVRRLNFWPAALITSVLFAASHADAYAIWPRAIALVATGLTLAWLYRWRGYAAAVTAHATVNGVAAIALIAAG
ncbi:MAG: CPBP family intramembrane glutamic endopeptidase [Thermoleophilia bacterium]